MLEKLCFDLCAVVVLLIILITLFIRKSVADKAGRHLMALIAITIVTAFLDIYSNSHNGLPGYTTINYLVSGLYHVTRSASLGIYARYIVLTTGIWTRGENVIIRQLRFVPFYIVTFFVVTAPNNHFIFYYLNDNYVRGKGFAIIYLCGAVYLIQALYIIIKSLPIIGYRRSASLASCAGLTILAAFVQFQLPYLYIDLIGFTLSLLFIVLFIDNPEDKVDGASLLMKHQVYINDLRNKFFMHRSFDIIHITVRNNKEISEMLDYSSYTAFKQTLGTKLKDIVRLNKLECDLYYIRDGKYRVVFNDNNYDRSLILAESLCNVFNGEIKVNESSIHVESAVSITQCPQDFSNLEDLLAFGSAAMVFEKIGQVVLTKDVLLEDTTSIRVHIDKYIERGLLDGGFKVFYHPILNTSNGKFDMVEATLKLLDKEKGLIDPELFMAVAEQNGSIIEIGLYVIDDVCRFVSSEEFAETGINKVNINLSVVQLMQKGFASQFISIIEKYNVTPDKIGIEVRESLATDVQKEFEININALTEYGIDATLDEYGAGYSNITTLSSMPIKSIKFDKSFIETENNDRLRVILENSIDMVKSLGKEIIIDGVESSKVIDKFAELGCERIQGTFDNIRPMPENMLCMFYQGLNSSV